MLDHVLFFLKIYSPHQFTPLRSAILKGCMNIDERGHVDIVRYLLEQGANPNIKDEEGVSE